MMVTVTFLQQATPRPLGWSPPALPTMVGSHGTALPAAAPRTLIPAAVTGAGTDMRVRNAKLDSPPRGEPR